MLRIALCDDEANARDALHIQLEKLLIEDVEEIVYEFSSGTNAVSWLAKHPGEIDLLFLDVEMNGLNGIFCGNGMKNVIYSLISSRAIGILDIT